jgi:1,4-alpha-glucan branching enzyme
MWACPGKKLIFMGDEIAQWREWDHDSSLEWHLVAYPSHAGVQRFVEDLNRLYREEPGLWQIDFAAEGYEWIDANDAEQSVISFVRKGRVADDIVLVVCNFTPVPRHNYRVGVPRGGVWREILNSDAALYGGAGFGNMGGVEASPVPSYGRPYSVNLTLPPLAALYFRLEEQTGWART